MRIHPYAIAIAVGTLFSLSHAAHAEVVPQVALQGACVPIPDVAFQMIVTHGSRDGGQDQRLRYGAATDHRHDLDLDGHLDALVPLPRARNPQESCPEDTRWEVYLSRGACGVRVGIFEGDFVEVDAQHPAHGMPTVLTSIDPGRPSRGRTHLRYAFDGTAYVETERRVDVARCEVHPADCRHAPFRGCELRGHPTIRSHFDGNTVSSQMLAAATAAQETCAMPGTRTERCDVHATIAPDGRVSGIAIRGCPRRRACVASIFRALRTEPYTGHAEMPSISFQIPAP